MAPSPVRVVVIMGVSGAGKTTVGRALAERLGWIFADADDVHPPENVAKMALGEPLTDADREGWLQALAALIDAHRARGEPLILACSALKACYRDLLRRPGCGSSSSRAPPKPSRRGSRRGPDTT